MRTSCVIQCWEGTPVLDSIANKGLENYKNLYPRYYFCFFDLVAAMLHFFKVSGAFPNPYDPTLIMNTIIDLCFHLTGIFHLMVLREASQSNSFQFHCLSKFCIRTFYSFEYFLLITNFCILFNYGFFFLSLLSALQIRNFSVALASSSLALLNLKIQLKPRPCRLIRINKLNHYKP